MRTQMFTFGQICRESTRSLESTSWHTSSPSTPTSRFYPVLRYLASASICPYVLDEFLHTLTTLLVQAMEADLCVIMLRNPEDYHLQMHACSSSTSSQDRVVPPLAVEPALWKRLRTSFTHGPALTLTELTALNPLPHEDYYTFLPIPLMTGAEYAGLLNCYASKPFHFNIDEQLLLSTIANQTALAIAYCLRTEEGAQAHKALVSAFMKELFSVGSGMEASLSGRARQFGCDLSRPYTVILVALSMAHVDYEMQPSKVLQEEHLAFFTTSIGQFNLEMQNRYPGSLIDARDHTLTCLLCLENVDDCGQVSAWLEQFALQVRRERQVVMIAGIGNPCQNVRDYQRSYSEASEALKLGQCLQQEGGSSSFSALGVYRYIYPFARDNRLCDQYQEQITALVEYDRRKKTSLLLTLECYLECGGNIARASSQLAIHRNTLLQRLERLQKLCVLDLEQMQNRLPLLLAIKVHRLNTNCSS